WPSTTSIGKEDWQGVGSIGGRRKVLTVYAWHLLAQKTWFMVVTFRTTKQCAILDRDRDGEMRSLIGKRNALGTLRLSVRQNSCSGVAIHREDGGRISPGGAKLKPKTRECSFDIPTLRKVHPQGNRKQCGMPSQCAVGLGCLSTSVAGQGAGSRPRRTSKSRRRQNVTRATVPRFETERERPRSATERNCTGRIEEPSDLGQRTRNTLKLIDIGKPPLKLTNYLRSKPSTNKPQYRRASTPTSLNADEPYYYYE
ncbi:hypothetical protein QBC37DRAFT_407318, partial [Rhypophila decipiens]